MRRKWFVAAICAILLSASSVALAQLRGDMNNDGKISLKDLALLTNYLKGGGTQTAVADVNGDGVTDVHDLGLLVKILLGEAPEEGLDCDNNSYIKITGPANVVALGGAQGGGSSSGIGSASQGYVLSTTSLSLQSGRYYTLSSSDGTNLFTFSLEASVSSSMSLISAAGMKSNTSYTLKYGTSAPTDATTEWHGFYLGSSAVGTTSVSTFTAK